MTIKRLLLATCPCGHKGRSRRPQFYQCSGCWYEGQIKASLEKARKLEARSQRLRELVGRLIAKRDAFREKHR